MLDHTVGVFAWGVALSLLVIVIAFLADGRGAYALRLVRGRTSIRSIKSIKDDVDVFATLARDEGDWQLVGRLSEIDRDAADREALRALTGTHR